MVEFKNIISISGMPGLYTTVAQRKDGALVRNLTGQQIEFVSSNNHNFSLLDAIGIYTFEVDTVPLSEVFRRMYRFEQDGSLPIPSPSANDTDLRGYFAQIVPNHDPARVYVSDIKKIIKWFGIIKKADAIPTEQSEAQEETLAAENNEQSVAAAGESTTDNV